MAITVLPWTIFVFKRTPEDKGLQPLGYNPNAPIVSDNAELKLGISPKAALKSVMFILMFLIIVGFSVGTGFRSNMVAMATEFLEGTIHAPNAAMIGAYMLSIGGAADIIGKVTMGWGVDRFGIRKTMIVFAGFQICAYTIWALFHQIAGLYIGAFLFGMHSAIIRVGIPLMIRGLFGPANFTKIYGYFTSAKGLSSGLAGTIVALFFDIGGSYQGSIIWGLCLAIMATILTLVCMRYLDRWKKMLTHQQEEAAV